MELQTLVCRMSSEVKNGLHSAFRTRKRVLTPGQISCLKTRRREVGRRMKNIPGSSRQLG